MVMMVGCSVCLCATIQIYIHMYTCNTCTDSFKNNILVIVSLLASVMVMMVGRSVRLCVRWTNHCVSLPLDSPLNRMSSHLSKKNAKKKGIDYSQVTMSNAWSADVGVPTHADMG